MVPFSIKCSTKEYKTNFAMTKKKQKSKFFQLTPNLFYIFMIFSHPIIAASRCKLYPI